MECKRGTRACLDILLRNHSSLLHFSDKIDNILRKCTQYKYTSTSVYLTSCLILCRRANGSDKYDYVLGIVNMKICRHSLQRNACNKNLDYHNVKWLFRLLSSLLRRTCVRVGFVKFHFNLICFPNQSTPHNAIKKL